MNDLFNQIFLALSNPLGSVVFHILIVYSLANAFQSAFSHWRLSEFPQARRTMLGLGLLLAAQFFMFAFSGLGWQKIINPTATLPPLDRAFTLITILWVTWLWGFPEPNRLVDYGFILLSLLVGTAMGLSLITWPAQASHVTYNATNDDRLWQIASITFILIGVFILLIRRPNGYGNGLAFLGLAFVGHVGHMAIDENGNYSGIIRLAYLAAFPILSTLAQRFPAPISLPEQKPTPVAPPIQPDKPTPAPNLVAVPEKKTATVKQDTPVPERRRYSTDPKTFHALLALAAASTASKVSAAITRAIAQTMLADLCFLIYFTDNKNQMVIASGYDLIREENLEGGSLNKDAIPMLTTALQRGKPLRLPASSTSADIKGLSDLLGLPTLGHLICVPIVSPEKDSVGGVLLLSPYSNKLWSAEDQAFLTNIATALVPIVQRSQKMTNLEQQANEAHQTLDAARSQMTELERRNDELTKQVDAMILRAEKESSKGKDVAALMAVQEDSQRTIEQLQKELEFLRNQGKRPESQVEDELKMTLQEVAHLQNQLASANTKILDLEKSNGNEQHRPSEQAEVIASISQELRQPMSSVIGYTDLLLGESVGILGALQRKFVERIKASIERIGNLMDEMIQVTTLETGIASLKPEPVDINLIIDNAMAYTSSQVREKNISMQLDLPKKVAPLYADREALLQILIHLLQNAGAATPVEGAIRLKVQTTSENNQDYVLIQVTDGGGGILPEDLPRVFTRLYRADNVLIQGIGDTGVGLSIAKTLTEAQHGRIWVESKALVGATFSVLIPVAKVSLQTKELQMQPLQSEAVQPKHPQTDAVRSTKIQTKPLQSQAQTKPLQTNKKDLE